MTNLSSDFGEGEGTPEPALNLSSNAVPYLPGGWHEPRKHPAHGVFQLTGEPTIAYLTVCTKNRDRWLANSEVHELLIMVWRNAVGWLVGHYMIMPDHIHLFAGFNGGKWSLGTWCQFWKRQFSVTHKIPEHRWQAGHWVRHGLVASASDWPFAGELNEFGEW